MSMPSLPPIGDPPGYEAPTQAPATDVPAPRSPVPASGRHHVVPPVTTVPWAVAAPRTDGASGASGWSTLDDVPVAAAAKAPRPASAPDQASTTPGAAAQRENEHPGVQPRPARRRRGIGIGVLVGIGVAAIVVGAGVTYGVNALMAPSALEGIPAQCNLAEGSYGLTDTSLVLHAPEQVSQSDRFNGDSMCVMYEIGVEPEGANYLDYLAQLEEPEQWGDYTLSTDHESGELKVEQS